MPQERGFTHPHRELSFYRFRFLRIPAPEEPERRLQIPGSNLPGQIPDEACRTKKFWKSGLDCMAGCWRKGEI